MCHAARGSSEDASLRERSSDGSQILRMMAAAFSGQESDKISELSGDDLEQARQCTGNVSAHRQANLGHLAQVRLLAGSPQVMAALHRQPALWRSAKALGQAQCHLGADPARACQHSIQR